MSEGIIYVTTTIVPGLIKIGKTGVNNFENRMTILENTGYRNVTGLERKFAIKVDDYDDKEKLLHDIFSKSRLDNTELFAIDVDLVIQLLSSFEGEQIYPIDKTKEKIFDEATEEVESKRGVDLIPNGTYYLNSNKKDFGEIEAKMSVEDGELTVLSGSICAPLSDVEESSVPAQRKNAKIENNILKKDITCNSPSTAGWIALGNFNNGWKVWKNEKGEPIDIYRNK